MTMTSMPLAEAKAHLSEVVGRVHEQHERVTVTVHGKPSAVILAPEDLERLEETIAVLADHALIQQLTQSDEDIATGMVEGLEELTRAMHSRTTSL